MRLDGITTLNMQNAQRMRGAKLQADLLQAQTELSSGRHADVALTLGQGLSRNFNWRAQISAYTQQIDVNKVAATRAALTQNGLEQLKGIANTLISTLAGARTAQNGQQLARQAATTAYDAMQQVLGSSFDGQNLFAGVNVTGKALNAYQGGPGALAVDTAFQAAFGMVPSDATAASITPSDLTNYLRTSFRQEFQDPSWSANWSDAAAGNVKTRLEGGIMIDSSSNANAPGIRQLVEATVAIMHAAQGQISSSAFGALTDEAMTLAAQGIAGIGEEQARVGIAQQEIKASSERISRKSDLLKAHVQETEGVDNYEAAMRVNQLMTQLETSYAVTAKISRLSLVNYI